MTAAKGFIEVLAEDLARDFARLPPDARRTRLATLRSALGPERAARNRVYLALLECLGEGDEEC